MPLRGINGHGFSAGTVGTEHVWHPRITALVIVPAIRIQAVATAIRSERMISLSRSWSRSWSRSLRSMMLAKRRAISACCAADPYVQQREHPLDENSFTHAHRSLHGVVCRQGHAHSSLAPPTVMSFLQRDHLLPAQRHLHSQPNSIRKALAKLHVSFRSGSRGPRWLANPRAGRRCAARSPIDTR